MALTQVKTTGLADDAVTSAKIADDAVVTAAIADDAVTGANIADDTVAEANMANDAISLTELKAGTDGQIITWDASGNPIAVGPGTDGQVLTSTGAGSPPAFESIPAGVGGATGVDFNDWVKIRLGTDNDAELYHDGSHVYLYNNTGFTHITGTIVRINSPAGEQMIEAIADGAVHLRHDASTKLSTSATGVSVTGNVAMSAGGGIDFSAETNTSVSGTSADSDENLNHYEYGTWTAAFSSGGSNTNANCDYIRIGKFVMISGNITLDDITTNAAIGVTGIPFSCINRDFTGSLRGYGIGNPTINTNTYANNSTLGGNDKVEFGAVAPQGLGWEMVYHNDFNLANNNSLRWTITYITDS